MSEFIPMPNDPTRMTETWDSTGSIKNMLNRCGLDVEKISKETKDRLALLNQEDGFLDEIQVSMRTMEKFFGLLEEAGIALTPEQKQHTLAGELLSDIGKTGNPENASTPEQRKVIYDLYKIKDIPFKKEGERFVPPTVEEVIRANRGSFPFPDDNIRIFDTIPEFPEGARASMRKLWDVHVFYTYTLLKNDSGIPPEVIAIASQHHFVEGHNPGNMLQPDGSYQAAFGTKAHFGYEEMVVMLMDKYHAFRLREKTMTHEQAMNALERLLKDTLKDKYAGKLPTLVGVMREKLS